MLAIDGLSSLPNPALARADIVQRSYPILAPPDASQGATDPASQPAAKAGNVGALISHNLIEPGMLSSMVGPNHRSLEELFTAQYDVIKMGISVTERSIQLRQDMIAENERMIDRLGARGGGMARSSIETLEHINEQSEAELVHKEISLAEQRRALEDFVNTFMGGDSRQPWPGINAPA